ncbi:hypothetical protein DL240_11140 [Lujinxingia litoralis]|uniref:Uncharacterized protein n=1 Tax=Lujinxingia litoralis TaxID=2211119 RepID=A0A328C592_9DELT|nr:hypothetical protein DL240_11140 [Lujinxingia litoralis]
MRRQPADEGSRQQKPVEAVAIEPPATPRRRMARFAEPGERKTRYSLPAELDSASPVGYRQRVALSRAQAQKALALLSLERPGGFGEVVAVPEGELFEECALGVLSARQSTNFRGHRQVTFGPEDSERLGHLLRSLGHLDAPVLEGASYTHVVLSRPYRTPFTLLLTLIGHRPVQSLVTVPWRALRKQVWHHDDIPSVGYLQQLHVGILADAMERAAVVASCGRRRAQVFSAPFCSEPRRRENRPMLRAIEEMCGVSAAERAQGWRVALVAQVGQAVEGEEVDLDRDLCRKLGANLMAFRSERIQPGSNADASAPAEYQEDQGMEVPEALTVMAGRAAYNAFAHWTGCERERAKELMMLERIDVLKPAGQARIAEVQEGLNQVTDRVLATLPKWADLPVGRAFSRNAQRGRKAFGLAGQRIYIGGLSRQEVAAQGLDWDQCVRAIGASASRSGLVAELMGVMELPPECDLLAGLCLMAGPVNQNDIGKAFYGQEDLLAKTFEGRDPTSLLVWTLKAKTVADPIGNEEQLMNPRRQGKLVDLRPGPHDIIKVKLDGELRPMRKHGEKVNAERAFGDVGNFVRDPQGRGIPGNQGARWPESWRAQVVWEVE